MTAEIIPFTPPPLRARDPRFVPAPSEMCQLAGAWEGSAIPAGWQAEEKHDGARMIWTEGALYSREGNPLDIPAVAIECLRLETRFGEPMTLDGEYLEPEGFIATLAMLKRRDKSAARGTLHLFDALPLDDWRADACELPLEARQALLRRAVGDWKPERLAIVPSVPVASRTDIETMARSVWARKGEGLMLKHRQSLYRRSRSDTWLKVKRKLELSGVVVEVLCDGAALAVEIGGRRVKVAVRTSLRSTLAVGMSVDIEAMEWTERGQLRQGLAVGIAGINQ